MPSVVEGVAKNFSEVTVDRITVVVEGRVGFEEALHSDIQTRRVSFGEGEFGSVDLSRLESVT